MHHLEGSSFSATLAVTLPWRLLEDSHMIESVEFIGPVTYKRCWNSTICESLIGQLATLWTCETFF